MASGGDSMYRVTNTGVAKKMSSTCTLVNSHFNHCNHLFSWYVLGAKSLGKYSKIKISKFCGFRHEGGGTVDHNVEIGKSTRKTKQSSHEC